MLRSRHPKVALGAVDLVESTIISMAVLSVTGHWTHLVLIMPRPTMQAPPPEARGARAPQGEGDH